MKKTLYVKRQLLNGVHFKEWASGQGFKKTLEVDDFHVTIAFSRREIEWPKKDIDADHLFNIIPENPKIVPLGDDGAVVFKFDSTHLKERWNRYMNYGASYDYDSYQPHITISYKCDKMPENIVPFSGALIFGPEEYSELDLNWKDKVNEH